MSIGTVRKQARVSYDEENRKKCPQRAYLLTGLQPYATRKKTEFFMFKAYVIPFYYYPGNLTQALDRMCYA